jgi:hypothetical protein
MLELIVYNMRCFILFGYDLLFQYLLDFVMKMCEKSFSRTQIYIPEI